MAPFFFSGGANWASRCHPESVRWHAITTRTAEIAVPFPVGDGRGANMRTILNLTVCPVTTFTRLQDATDYTAGPQLVTRCALNTGLMENQALSHSGSLEDRGAVVHSGYERVALSRRAFLTRIHRQ